MRVVTMIALALACTTAFAGSVTDIGKTTRDVLAKQREGEGAVEPRPMVKDSVERSYERYLESFTHSIPDQYEGGEGFSGSN